LGRVKRFAKVAGEMVSLALRREGYRTEGFDDGMTAWEAFARTHVPAGEAMDVVGLRDHAAIHLGVAVKPPHRLAAADRAHVVLDGIAGHHGFSEFALVDGEKIDGARLLAFRFLLTIGGIGALALAAGAVALEKWTEHRPGWGLRWGRDRTPALARFRRRRPCVIRRRSAAPCH